MMAHLQMPQLPRARKHQYYHLCQTIPNGAGVRRLAEVAEVCLSLTLILLLAPYIFQLLVQVAQFCRQFGYVRPVVFEVGFGLTDDNVQV